MTIKESLGMATLLLYAVLSTAVGATNLLGKPPKATAATNAAELANMAFHMPQITEAPSARDLARRQSSSVNTVLVGPDNTCGYIDGRAGAIYSCVDESATCVFVTTTSSLGWVACCNDETCGLRNDCVDYNQLNSQSVCGNGCYGDPYTVKCTDSRLPYCATISFTDGIMDYYCDVYSGSQTQQAYTTYYGETDDHSFTEVPVTDSDTVSSEFPSVFPSDDTTQSTGPSATGTTSIDPTGSNNGQSNNGNNGGDDNSSGGSSTNIGAIVGGVVGGVALLALIAVGLFFLIRKNKKDKQAAAAGGAIAPPGGPGYQQPPMGQQPQQYGSPAGTQSMYGQPQGFNPQYPQQQGGYGAPEQQHQSMYYPDQHQDPSKLAAFGAAAGVAGGPIDRNSSVSPAGSPHANSLQPTSPTSTHHSGYPSGGAHMVSQQHTGSSAPPYQQQQQAPQSPVYEAGSNPVGGAVDYNANHRGQFHEMG